MLFKILLITTLIASTAYVDVVKQGEVTVGTKEPSERLLAPMHVDVKVSADGKVMAVRADPNIPASISERLAKAVSQWKFSPAKRQGAPIDWATRVNVTLTAVPIEKGYALRVNKMSVASVWIPPDEMRNINYPSSEMLKGRSAELALILEPGIDGNPTVVRSVYVDGKLATNNKRDLLVKAARAAAAQWKYQAMEWDGVKYVEPVCVPVIYLVNKEPSSQGESVCKSTPEVRDEQFLPIKVETKPEGSMI